VAADPRARGAVVATGIEVVYRNASGDVRALAGVDVGLATGVTAIVGPSGSGKSSLLRVLGLIDRPSAGVVRIDDREVSALRAGQRRRVRRQRIGYLFQRPADNLIAHLSALENLRLSARIRGDGDAEPVALLASLGLADRAGHPVERLSGGEQQRLAVAAAVIGAPAVVLADEPTAELDAVSAARLLEVVETMARGGTTFAVATHDPAVVAIASHVVHLRHGVVDRS
jgi:putative ABC transport system ATP-binding protein